MLKIGVLSEIYLSLLWTWSITTRSFCFFDILFMSKYIELMSQLKNWHLVDKNPNVKKPPSQNWLWDVRIFYVTSLWQWCLRRKGLWHSYFCHGLLCHATWMLTWRWLGSYYRRHKVEIWSVAAHVASRFVVDQAHCLGPWKLIFLWPIYFCKSQNFSPNWSKVKCPSYIFSRPA
jgi:hypothetical protein